MAFSALWQTANRTNARLKATIGGFHGPLTFFIESPSFFDNSFDMYPIGEKTEVADSEKRTPEVNFRLFFSTFQKNHFFSKIHIFDPPEPRKRASESHQVEVGRGLQMSPRLHFPLPKGNLSELPGPKGTQNQVRRTTFLLRGESGFVYWAARGSQGCPGVPRGAQGCR